LTEAPDSSGVASVQMLSDDVIDPVYEAAVQATEEAIINAMLAARTMTGANWYRVPALPRGTAGRAGPVRAPSEVRLRPGEPHSIGS
jgi:L-aminopeptidase/D-esterase-like protein